MNKLHAALTHLIASQITPSDEIIPDLTVGFEKAQKDDSVVFYVPLENALRKNKALKESLNLLEEIGVFSADEKEQLWAHLKKLHLKEHDDYLKHPPLFENAAIGTEEKHHDYFLGQHRGWQPCVPIVISLDDGAKQKLTAKLIAQAEKDLKQAYKSAAEDVKFDYTQQYGLSDRSFNLALRASSAGQGKGGR